MEQPPRLVAKGEFSLVVNCTAHSMVSSNLH